MVCLPGTSGPQSPYWDKHSYRSQCLVQTKYMPPGLSSAPADLGTNRRHRYHRQILFHAHQSAEQMRHNLLLVSNLFFHGQPPFGAHCSSELSIPLCSNLQENKRPPSYGGKEGGSSMYYCFLFCSTWKCDRARQDQGATSRRDIHHL